MVTRRAVAVVGSLLLLPCVPFQGGIAEAQATATTASPAARQIGTIDAISGSSISLTTDKGEKIAVTLVPETKVVQLPPGSTDLKAAQPAAISDVAVGDRVLAIGAPADTASALTARRLVLMKSTDIAKRRETEQAGWQHGSGGIVSSVDPGTGAVIIKSGSRSIAITTGPSTIVRRYAPGSARFEDATKSSLADLHPGDQLRVRGDREGEGSIKADEIVSGAFQQLSGPVQAIDATGGKLTVKDAKTGKPAVLSVTAGTAIHQLPPEVAARLAARAKAAGNAPAATAGAGGHATTASPAAGAEGTSGRTGGDLSQVVSRLPSVPLSDLKVGDTVMVVGGEGSAGSVTAITILSGVQAILAASPSGSAEMTLSPWSVGGGGEAAGSAQ